MAKPGFGLATTAAGKLAKSKDRSNTREVANHSQVVEINSGLFAGRPPITPIAADAIQIRSGVKRPGRANFRGHTVIVGHCRSDAAIRFKQLQTRGGRS